MLGDEDLEFLRYWIGIRLG